MFKKLEERSNMLSRDTQDKYKIQIKFLKMKTTMFEKKNNQDESEKRLHIAEKNE